jgi:hypothetical protein
VGEEVTRVEFCATVYQYVVHWRERGYVVTRRAADDGVCTWTVTHVSAYASGDRYICEFDARGREVVALRAATGALLEAQDFARDFTQSKAFPLPRKKKADEVPDPRQLTLEGTMEARNG